MDIHVLVDLIGVSAVTALITGAMLGLYLAAVNKFVPTRKLRRSLVNDIVIGLSFFLPVAIQRDLLDVPTLDYTSWFALMVIWLIFSITADVVNSIICHHKYQNQPKN